MANENAKLLTIITEAALESHLIDDIEAHGAAGYTITNARGRGSRGRRKASWEADANIRVEVICHEKLAGELVEHMQTHYYDNYAMVTFVSDIEVLRPLKFKR